MNGNLDSLVSSLDKISPESNSNLSTAKCFDLATKCLINDVEHSRIDHGGSVNNNNNCSEHKANNIVNSHQTNNHNQFISNDKKFKNYKLISDPMLKKGAQKIYRYDGVVSSKEPPLLVKDPRSRLSLFKNVQVTLIFPRFKIDKNYVGIPPPIEVSITNLNDNINKSFLEDMLKKFDLFEEMEIFYHPKTKKHLGLARVIFLTKAGAQSCVEKLNQTSVMGNIINVFFDPFGKEINNIFENIVNPPPSNTLPSDGFMDPNSLDKLNSSLAQTTNDFNYLTSDSTRIPTTEFSSTLTTPSSFDTQNFFQPNSSSQNFGENTEQWNDEYDWNSNTDKSPIRESLDARIKNLLNQPRVALGFNFLNHINCTEFNSALNLNKKDTPHRKNNQLKIDDSEAILGTPPSPFVSASEYLKWHKVTNEIDLISNPVIFDDEVACKGSKEDDDDDDDRMSLSSLSSGEKLEDNSLSNTMYSSDHVQMLRNPFANSNGHPFCPENFNSALLPQFMYQTFVPQSTSHPFGLFSGFSVPSSFGLPSDLFSNKTNDPKQMKPTKEHLQPLIVQFTKNYAKEFREIIIKDIYRKIVENFSFKTFDHWWEESEKKLKSDENHSHNIYERSHSYRGSDMFNNLLENTANIKESNSEFSLRGLRAAMPKMPSFKRKIIKPKSPTNSIDDNLSDISEDEIEIDRKPYKNRSISNHKEMLKPRRRYSISSRDSRSSRVSRSSLSSRSKSSQSSNSSSSSSSNSSSASSSASSSSESSSETTSSSEQSGSDESESESSSSSHSKSLSRHSVSSTKSASPIRRSKRKELPPIESDSSTCTADETIEEERKLELQEAEARRLRDNYLKDVAKSETSMLEYEASQALISLSSGYSMNNNQTNNFEFTEKSDINLHLKDHDYCLPSVPEEKVKPKVPRSRKVNKENVEKKRRKKKGDLVDENITPNVPAVASEWRNAKGNKVTSTIDNLLNDENKIKPEIIEPDITFSKRDPQKEREILYEFLNQGVDSEDIKYLKRSFDDMIQNESKLWWIHDVHWVDHPPTFLSTPKKKRKADDSANRVHKTGCARTEGYYKMDSSEKMKYSHVVNVSNENDGNKTIKARQIATTQQLTRDARSHQRRLMTSFDYCDLMKFNQLKFRRKQLKFSKSLIHDWGLFALEPIAADEMVIEYVGQQIRSIIADVRERKYYQIGIGSSYLFRVDLETIVDATRCGNVARFINHSCNPNCYARVITVEGKKKIVIYSKQAIAVGEEITYDYKFPIEDDDKIICLCQSAQCRGFLN